MSSIELRQKLIDQIQKIDDINLLEEVSRLIDLETVDIEIYKLSEDQKKAIAEAKNQIKKGDFLTDSESNRETDEWLKK